MRPYLLILLLLSLLPRYVNAGLMHAQNCTMVAPNSTVQVMAHEIASMHEHDLHHHQTTDKAEAIAADVGLDVDSALSASPTSMDCDHCDDCHDHCGAMLISSLSSARYGSLHDLSVQTALILVQSRHERISRPPRV